MLNCWHSLASNPAQHCKGSASLRHHCWDSPALSRPALSPQCCLLPAAALEGNVGKPLPAQRFPQARKLRSLEPGCGERHTVNSPKLFRSRLSSQTSVPRSQVTAGLWFASEGGSYSARWLLSSLQSGQSPNVSTSPRLGWDTWKAVTTPGHATGPYALHVFVGTFYSEAFHTSTPNPLLCCPPSHQPSPPGARAQDGVGPSEGGHSPDSTFPSMAGDDMVRDAL